VSEGLIKIHEVENRTFLKRYYGRLHKGDLEVIAGAKEIGASIVIIDEKSARNFAESLMLKPLGLMGILKLAKQKGRISQIRPLLDLLISKKFRISEKMYNQLLMEVGEK
jgi:predicted nucleic acid-binding protein